ncbi:sensor histidine kinase [Nocardioides sp. AX2bis]|uniref:sensor histidine kinase n=1 Tax=Nocardioides sp. AX2bis TaxID=2653157 RepID=UPI0012F35F96|nr:MASE4 domain-containing protein [Nocardioides sp. AX2bis]VXB28844.1 putative Histidine kinase [Nocardioides sp. AX2bis]
MVAARLISPQPHTPASTGRDDGRDEGRVDGREGRPGDTARRTVLLVAAALVPVVLALLLVARQPLGEVPAFLPAFLTLVLGIDLLTAVLLTEQYRTGAGPRLLVLSWAYTFSSVTVFFHGLTFPGVLAPEGLMNAAPSSAAWLWTSWHAGFALLLGLALVPWPRAVHDLLVRPEARSRRILTTHGTVVLVALTVVVWTTIGSATVPAVLDGADYTALSRAVGLPMAAVVLVSLGLALRGFAARRRLGPEGWALVAVVATGGDVALTLLAGDRFTLGWYAARSLALAAAVVVLLALLREITALHRRVRHDAVRLAAQNADLREAQAARDHLTAVVTHDMRIPVTGIAGYLELLEDADLPRDQATRMVHRGQELTRRLTLMIEDLLTAAKSDQGVLGIHPRTLRVGSVFEEVAAAFPDAEIHLEGDLALPLVADPLRLQQVLDNLVTNAVKYGAPPVRLRAEAADGGVAIAVDDAGAGVPETFVDHLFDRYSRAPEHEDAAGSGLGLSVVRDLVHAHGGTVSYDRARGGFDLFFPDRPTVASLSTEVPTTVPVAEV